MHRILLGLAIGFLFGFAFTFCSAAVAWKLMFKDGEEALQVARMRWALEMTLWTVGGTLIGTVQVQGNSLDTDTIALWLTRVEQIKGWVNAWVSAFTKTAAGSTPVWQFTSTIDLTSKAAQPGGQQ